MAEGALRLVNRVARQDHDHIIGEPDAHEGHAVASARRQRRGDLCRRPWATAGGAVDKERRGGAGGAGHIVFGRCAASAATAAAQQCSLLPVLQLARPVFFGRL